MKVGFSSSLKSMSKVRDPPIDPAALRLRPRVCRQRCPGVAGGRGGARHPAARLVLGQAPAVQPGGADLGVHCSSMHGMDYTDYCMPALTSQNLVLLGMGSCSWR